MSPEPFSGLAIRFPFFFPLARFFFFFSSSNDEHYSSSDEVLPLAEEGSFDEGVAPLRFLRPPFDLRPTDFWPLPLQLSVEVSKASAEAITSSMVSHFPFLQKVSISRGNTVTYQATTCWVEQGTPASVFEILSRRSWNLLVKSRRFSFRSC